jgi:hypothetical protein
VREVSGLEITLAVDRRVTVFLRLNEQQWINSTISRQSSRLFVSLSERGSEKRQDHIVVLLVMIETERNKIGTGIRCGISGCTWTWKTGTAIS